MNHWEYYHGYILGAYWPYWLLILFGVIWLVRKEENKRASRLQQENVDRKNANILGWLWAHGYRAPQGVLVRVDSERKTLTLEVPFRHGNSSAMRTFDIDEYQSRWHPYLYGERGDRVAISAQDFQKAGLELLASEEKFRVSATGSLTAA